MCWGGGGEGDVIQLQSTLQIVITSVEVFLNFSLKSHSPGHKQVTEDKCIMSPFLMHLNAKQCVWTAADTDFAV